MAKERTIEHSFYDDTEIAALSIAERYLFQGMIARCADDEGRLHAEPAYLRKEIFGYDDSVSKADVEAMLANIVQHCRNVVYYEVGGQAYIWLVKFAAKQKIRWVVLSKLPPPPQNEAPSYINPPIAEVSGNLQEIAENSGSRESRAVGEGRVEKGRVGVGSGAEVSGTPPPPPDEVASQETNAVPEAATQPANPIQQLLAAIPRPDGLDPKSWQRFVVEAHDEAVRLGRDPAVMLTAMLPDLAQDIRRWQDEDPKTRGALINWLRNRIGFYLRDNPLHTNGVHANGHATAIPAPEGPRREVPTPEQAADIKQRLNGRIADIASRARGPRAKEPGPA